MAINLATKYEPKIAEKYTKESFTAGNASTDYKWTGARTIEVATIVSSDLNDYDRTASSDRFGTTIEAQDVVQSMECSKDKGFSVSIDHGNQVDQMNIKGAAKVMNIQISEKVVPFMDKYIFERWVQKAGTHGSISTPTKGTIVGLIKDGASSLDNALVPDSNRALFIPVTYCDMLELSDEFQKVENLLGKVLEKGYKGTVFGMKVIRVPDSYFPTNAYFLIAHKRAILAPNKIKTARILDNVKGIDGNVVEGRNYFDAFVLGAKAEGVYAGVLSTTVAGAPVITAAGGAITEANATTIYYTTDESDPRYSKTRSAIASGSAPSNHADGVIVKAYCERTGYFDSAVTTAELSA